MPGGEEDGSPYYIFMLDPLSYSLGTFGVDEFFFWKFVWIIEVKSAKFAIFFLKSKEEIFKNTPKRELF